MNKFQPHIIPVYPPNNELIFEEWFAKEYKGCNTDRILMPFFPTSYWVNNDYANDLVAKREAQDYIDSLSNDVKWFILCQYDDGCLIDWGKKDVLEFNMSKQNGIMLPLLCMPHPYSFTYPKRYFANFVGGKTHPIRDSAIQYRNKEDWYVSYDLHDITSYCRILHESIFTLCYRGYGANSFRCCEAMQYGSIPVYISDEFIIPSWLNFNDFGVLINSEDAHWIDEILESISPEEILRKQGNIKEAYQKYYTYESNLNIIIDQLQIEYHSRKTA